MAILLFLGILKISRALQRERRIYHYSLDLNHNEDLSLIERASNQYHKLATSLQQKSFLKKYSKKYEKYIEAGENQSAISFVINKLIIAFSFVLLVIVSYAIQGKIISFLGFLVCLIVGYYIYDIYFWYQKKTRKKKIKNEILRAVIVMNNAFKAGKSTLQAVEIASHDLPNPIGKEFKKIYRDMSYGLSVDVAFGRFAKRVGIEEANYISSSLTILNITGGNIVMVFSSIEKTLFDKKKLEEDLKNSTAASNLVVKVLMVIPILFVTVIYMVSPTYFDPLFSSFLGYIILAIIGIMFLVYLYLLNKILKVQV